MTNQAKQVSDLSRRNFVKSTSISAAAFTIVPRHVLGGSGFVAPSDKVNVGVVGVGGRGRRNVQALLDLENVQVVAIADPAEYWDLANFYYRSNAGRGPVKEMIEKHYVTSTPNYKVSEYLDFRRMLEAESALDAILCATPDHTHAYVSILAMRAGKHVYCEKPLTHNIWEARLVQRVARETGLATQMGNQLHSVEGIRQSVEYLRAQVIGAVHEVHSWVPATRWTAGLQGLPTGTSPIPKGLDWDLWLGPRASRPFHEVYAPVTWRDFWDFGCGAMGDFGCHDLDAAVWGLNLAAPESVELFPAGYNDQDIAPHGEIGYYRFPARGDQQPVQVTWYSGGLRPAHPALLPDDISLSPRGALYVGEKGIMLYEGRGQAPKVFPKSLMDSVDLSQPSIAPTKGHHADWIAAIQGGESASSNFEYAARLTEITLLGVLSLRLGGKKIHWDAVNMKVKGMSEADRFIREPVREGWEMG
ncbi:MAG: Gfo/Idh/MocA family oxidoreductase [Saprospiraceae bacterium]|nr:Gfo/Idh/MocA family oxidoreductase [Saprospiraceae bacterium]